MLGSSWVHRQASPQNPLASQLLQGRQGSGLLTPTSRISTESSERDIRSLWSLGYLSKVLEVIYLVGELCPEKNSSNCISATTGFPTLCLHPLGPQKVLALAPPQTAAIQVWRPLVLFCLPCAFRMKGAGTVV